MASIAEQIYNTVTVEVFLGGWGVGVLVLGFLGGFFGKTFCSIHSWINDNDIYNGEANQTYAKGLNTSSNN